MVHIRVPRDKVKDWVKRGVFLWVVMFLVLLVKARKGPAWRTGAFVVGLVGLLGVTAVSIKSVRELVDHRLSRSLLSRVRETPPPPGQSVLCFMHYDTNHGYEKYAFALNRAYCAKHGYRLEFIDGYETYPPWWRKVFILRDLLRNGAKEDYVMWMDSDAVFADPGISTTALFAQYPKAVFHVGRDAADSFVGHLVPHANAGVFAVRNNAEGRAFVEKWAVQYDSKRWCAPNASCSIKTSENTHYNGNNWRTDGAWASKTFEQGAMNSLIKESPSSTVAVYPTHVLSSRNAEFVKHMMSKSNKKRIKEFAEMCANAGIRVD